MASSRTSQPSVISYSQNCSHLHANSTAFQSEPLRSHVNEYKREIVNIQHELGPTPITFDYDTYTLKPFCPTRKDSSVRLKTSGLSKYIKENPHDRAYCLCGTENPSLPEESRIAAFRQVKKEDGTWPKGMWFQACHCSPSVCGLLVPLPETPTQIAAVQKASGKKRKRNEEPSSPATPRVCRPRLDPAQSLPPLTPALSSPTQPASTLVAPSSPAPSTCSDELPDPDELYRIPASRKVALATSSLSQALSKPGLENKGASLDDLAEILCARERCGICGLYFLRKQFKAHIAPNGPHRDVYTYTDSIMQLTNKRAVYVDVSTGTDD
ncbi:hypothetical protein FRC04_004550 [Tulasnella sp. 424]|nr:hypothetical protein FRC04_004550 [Tulasnella sp. 424]KAG8976618.1 hypothetical protein FRC05_003457 [Tulasnella sp. 425]